jgi:hypothetical protein
MSAFGGEYLQILREMASEDMDRDDYVTMDRIDRGFIIEEQILTFSGITVNIKVPKYACHATIQESEEDFR